MNQDAEITHFMRDFVEQDGNRCREADRNTHEITRSDNQAVDKIMYRISDQIHDRKRMDVSLGNRHMTVISVDNFFSNEAEKNSHKDKN